MRDDKPLKSDDFLLACVEFLSMIKVQRVWLVEYMLFGFKVECPLGGAKYTFYFHAFSAAAFLKITKHYKLIFVKL